MRTLRLELIAAIVIVITLGIAPNTMAQKSISGMQDIGQLMTIAKNKYDFSKQDAVILFEGKKLYSLPDGRLVDFSHEIVWINTDHAIEHYGDHRIPYDSKHCDFKVVTVRTWRDNQWWETGPTGIVETLPFEVEKAYDYADLRDMMLLHNGIELPCIIEVAYYIEDKEPFRSSVDGIWSFAKEDPVVWSWFGCGVPKGEKPKTLTSKTIGNPEVETDDKWDVDVYWWKTGPWNAVPESFSQNPASDVPYIAWSNWDSWRAYGDYINGLITKSDDIDSAIVLAVDSVITDTYTDSEKASLIAGFIDDKTRMLEIDNKFKLDTPRPALRTYNTAYANRFERAVLAKAMFESAGLQAQAVYFGSAYGKVLPDIPTLDAMTGIDLWLKGDNLDAIYNPPTGQIISGNSVIVNRELWRPGVDPKPILNADNTGLSSLDLKLELEYNTTDNKFTGKGFYTADNALSPYGKMIGIDDETKSFLNKLLGSVIKSAKVTNFNLERLDPNQVRCGFEYEIDKPEPDDLGRLNLVMGEPSPGLFDYRPGNIRLTDQEISSVISMPTKITQAVTLKIRLSDLQLVYQPQSITTTNDAGEFTAKIVKDDESLTVTKKLSTMKRIYHPDDWPALRQLLLDESDERYSTIIVKAEKAEKD